MMETTQIRTHKQKGYHSTRNKLSGYTAKLYDTEVVAYSESMGRIQFKHGGWITNSTTKAINGALKELGLNGLYKATIKSKAMFIQVFENKKVVDQFLVNA